MAVAIAGLRFHTVCMSSRAAAPRLRPHIRVSDADRERVADLLRHCAGEGRLTPDELEERLDGAYRAVYGSDLDELVADLPVAPLVPARAQRRPPGGRRHEGGVALPLVVVGLLAALVPGVAWMAMLAALFFGVFFAAATLAAIGVAFAPMLVVLAVALATRRRRRARFARHAPHRLPYDRF